MPAAGYASARHAAMRDMPMPLRAPESARYARSRRVVSRMRALLCAAAAADYAPRHVTFALLPASAYFSRCH